MRLLTVQQIIMLSSFDVRRQTLTFQMLAASLRPGEGAHGGVDRPHSAALPEAVRRKIPAWASLPANPRIIAPGLT